MKSLAIPTFICLKYLAYTAYCYGGFLWFQKVDSHSWARSFQLALLRMAMGIALGLGLLFFFSQFQSGQSRIGVPPWLGSWLTTYIVFYGALRILEWGFIAYLINAKNWALNSRFVVWVSGAVWLSFFTDWLGTTVFYKAVGGFC